METRAAARASAVLLREEGGAQRRRTLRDRRGKRFSLTGGIISRGSDRDSFAEDHLA